MSSTERAPEPTMEEILASIRRIISDDETNVAQDNAAAGQPAADEVEEEAADTQIIDDIARVLSGASTTAEAGEDEILDLTDLGAPAEAASEPAEMRVVAEIVQTEIVETEIVLEATPSPDFSQAFPQTSEDRPEPAPAAAIPAESVEPLPPVVAAPVPEPLPETKPQPEDPTAALERAIAALKAGDLAAFAREAESKYAAPAAPSMPPAPAQEPLPDAGPTLAEQFPAPAAAPPVLEPAPILEEELVILSEPAPPLATAAPPPLGETLAEPEAAPAPWSGDEPQWGKSVTLPFQPSAPRTNGGSAHKAHDFSVSGPKSLEDSVKEMLRPMLRKWLDENMQRVLTQALREELEDPQAPRRES